MNVLPSDLHGVLRANLMGRLSLYEAPYGPVPLVYADWTAAGRPLALVERYMAEKVLPVHANTHSTTSLCGMHTTQLYSEVRTQIHTRPNHIK
jgi:selenocysteine lyase/cysteine desulfurase